MADFDRKVIRRRWLNQILSWCIRGWVDGEQYTREQIVKFIEEDAQALKNVPEVVVLLRMFKIGMSEKSIGAYLREVI